MAGADLEKADGVVFIGYSLWASPCFKGKVQWWCKCCEICRQTSTSISAANMGSWGSRWQPGPRKKCPLEFGSL